MDYLKMKGIVVGIIILVIVTSFIPSTHGNISKIDEGSAAYQSFNEGHYEFFQNVELTISPNPAPFGYPITFTVTNNWTETILLPYDPWFTIKNENDTVIYPGGALPVITYVYTYESVESDWEQKDLNGTQVSPGFYTVEVDFFVEYLHDEVYQYTISGEFEIQPGEYIAFIRGDAEGDGNVRMSDGIYILRYLYVPGSPVPTCLDSADVDDNGIIEMSDAIYMLKHLYVPDSPEPPYPYPYCGVDLTQDELDCGYHPCMQSIK